MSLDRAHESAFACPKLQREYVSMIVPEGSSDGTNESWLQQNAKILCSGWLAVCHKLLIVAFRAQFAIGSHYALEIVVRPIISCFHTFSLQTKF